MFTNPPPRPLEWMHNKRCLGAALIEAVENLRDDKHMTDHQFVIAVQNGELREIAFGYLHDGLITCKCPD
jgi:hypothetical protein